MRESEERWLWKQAQGHLESTSFFHVTVKRGERNKGRENQEHILTNPNHKTNNLKPNHRRPRKSVISTWEVMLQPSRVNPHSCHKPQPKPSAFTPGYTASSWESIQLEPREMSRTWDCTLGPTLAHETLCYQGQMLCCSKPVKHRIVTCRKILRKHPFQLAVHMLPTVTHRH